MSQQATFKPNIIWKKITFREIITLSVVFVSGHIITLDYALHSTSTAKKARKQIMRNSQITDESLDPEFGRLRLNKHLDHLPAETSSSTSARCQFHRWLGHETCKSVSFCAACNVNLCVHCYKIFHQEEHLVAQKDALKIKLDPKPKSTDTIG